VQNTLTRAGSGELGRGDAATDTKPVCRYQRTPGELIHVDIKKSDEATTTTTGVEASATDIPTQRSTPAPASSTWRSSTMRRSPLQPSLLTD